MQRVGLVFPNWFSLLLIGPFLPKTPISVTHFSTNSNLVTISSDVFTKFDRIVSDSSCELNHFPHSLEKCENSLSKAQKVELVLGLVNCYLQQLGQNSLCVDDWASASECVSLLQGHGLLLFTEFYREFDSHCRHLLLVREIQLKAGLLLKLEKVSEGLSEQV